MEMSVRRWLLGVNCGGAEDSIIHNPVRVKSSLENFLFEIIGK